MAKKILIVAYFYPPFNNGGIQRIINFKNYLPRFGYDIDVVTTNALGSINKEQGVYRFYDKHYLPTRKINPFLKLFIKVMRRIKVWLGLATDFNYAWKNEVLKHINEKIDVSSYDFILASFPPAADLEIGLAFSKRYNIPLIADYRDGLMYDPFMYINSSPFIKYRSKRFEREIAQHASLQIAVSPVLGEYFRNKYPQTSTIYIPNGFDDEEVFPDEIVVDLPNGFNIIYTGGMASSRKTYSVFLITKIIETNPTVNFIFIGNYTKEEKKALTSCQNVFLYDQMDRKNIIPIQRKADMLLLRTGDDPGGLTGKIFEYLFAHKPILHVGGHNVAEKVITETNSGATFHPTDIENIHRFIENVKSNKLFFEYKNLEKYTRREQIKKLAKVLDALPRKELKN